MIAISLSPATAIPLPSGAPPADTADPFAALLAALLPVDAALPDAAMPVEEGPAEERPAGERPAGERTVDAAGDPAAGAPVSPEAVLALVAPAPLLVPTRTPADHATVGPRQVPKADGVAPAPEKSARRAPPGEVDAAKAPLLPLSPRPERPGALQMVLPVDVTPVPERAVLADAPLPGPTPESHVPDSLSPPLRDGPPPPLREAALAGQPRPVRHVEQAHAPEPARRAVVSDQAESIHATQSAPVPELVRQPEPARQPEMARQQADLPRDHEQRPPILAAVQTVAPAAPAAPATPLPPASPGQASVTAQQLAGQIATALPRLRQSGGEAVLTLDPARLGRVTLSWQSGSGGAPVLTVRAVEPVTATLLTRLGDDITAMLRAEPMLAGGGATDLRLDIGRAERVAEGRQADMRLAEGSTAGTGRELASDTGQFRQPQRGPAFVDPRTQEWRRDAVNPDDHLDSAAPQTGRDALRARLA